MTPADSDEPFSLTSVPPTSFTYVAEGGANLVAAYTGEDNDNASVLRNTVLRIRKKAHNAAPLSHTALREEDASVAFTDSVVVPLLPPHSTPRLVSVPVNDKECFQRLARHLHEARPATRRAIDDIDTDRGYVVLAENLVGTANDESMQLAVEIKPKWGFLPNPAHLSESSRPIKTRHCRFCLHSLHKATSKKEHVHSPHSHQVHAASSALHQAPSSTSAAGHNDSEHYCPLDLYSQDRPRVLKALKALIKSWERTNGKGNNLKLFYEGEMVIPSENTGFLGDMDDIEHSLPDLLVDFMGTTPLLKRLATLQRTLDPLDIEGLGKIIAEQTGVDPLTAAEDELVSKLGGEISLQEYTDFVSEYLEHERTSSSESSPNEQEQEQSPSLNEQTPLRTLVIAYLLSASFKDCSMMISIKQAPYPASDSPGSSPTSPAVRPTVASAPPTGATATAPSTHNGREIQAFLVDVDVKSIARMGRYARLDRDLVRNYEEYIAGGGEHLGVCRE